MRRLRSHPDPSERLRAIRALPDERASAAQLLEAVEDPSLDVARAALRRLVTLAAAEEVAALRERLLDLDIGIVPDAAAALRRLGDPHATALAVRGLASDSAFRRHKAALALRELDDPAARDALLRALDDAEAPVRRVAVEALGRLPPDDAALAGCRGRLADPDPSVRVAAVTALAAVDPAPGQTLAPLTADPDLRVRRQLASAACLLATEGVLSLLADREPVVRAETLHALTACSERVQPDALLAGLHDPHWRVRRAACDTLAAAGDDAAAGALLDALVDPHLAVRGRALVALERRHGRRLDAALEDALPDATAPLRRALVEILGRRGRGEIARPLAADPAPDVRIAVAHALAASDSPDALAALRFLLADDDPGVRNAAAAVLETRPRPDDGTPPPLS